MAAEDRGGIPEALCVNGAPGGTVSPLERGLHYGDGLFETIACVAGRPRFLALHLARLTLGCTRLAIDARALDGLEAEVTELAAQAARAIVKVLLTRGPAEKRGYAVTGAEKATRITLRYPWEPQDPQLARAGVRVRTAGLRLGENPALAGLKHCNRLEQVLARSEWSDPQVAEALMFSSSGRLISGTMSNVFVVQGSKLLTPRVDRCGVAGVMRRVVLREAAGAGIPVAEADIDADGLARAGELFLTSALIGLRPVGEIDGRALAVGPVTRALQERLAPLLTGGGDG